MCHLISVTQPITPSHLLHGRRIVMLPHSKAEDEVHDPDFGDTSVIRSRAKKQACIIRHFKSCWKHKYLTALREAYRAHGSNTQQIKVGDVMLIYNDSPRINWRMAVIEPVNKGRDGIICSVNIRTTTRRINHPITRLYLL